MAGHLCDEHEISAVADEVGQAGVAQHMRRKTLDTGIGPELISFPIDRAESLPPARFTNNGWRPSASTSGRSRIQVPIASRAARFNGTRRCSSRLARRTTTSPVRAVSDTSSRSRAAHSLTLTAV
jgi:hypothetical protein